MKLEELLDVDELTKEIAAGYVRTVAHPTLPIAIYNYTNKAQFDDHWTPTVCQTRGLIVDLTTNEIISRPFTKFFNLDHLSQPNYHRNNLPTINPEVTEKMDGWFGILWKSNGQYGIASRGSFTSEGAVFGTEKLKKLIKYGAIEEFPKGYTPIFEIIFKAGRIVVDYNYEGLVLLALVNNETGEEMPWEEMRNIWAKIASYSQGSPWIRLVHAHHMELDACLRDPDKKREGYVLTYHRRGTYPIKVKVKLEEYKRLHRLITGVTPQQLWSQLADPLFDWVRGDVPSHFREWTDNWTRKFYNEFHIKLVRQIDTAWCLKETYATGGSKAVVEVLEREKNLNKGIVLDLLKGEYFNAHQAIWKSIRPHGRQEDVFYREGEKE